MVVFFETGFYLIKITHTIIHDDALSQLRLLQSIIILWSHHIIIQNMDMYFPYLCVFLFIIAL